MTAKTLPSVAYLTNFQLFQFNKLLTVSEWDDLSTSLEEYVDQRLNHSSPLTQPILTIVQATPSVRLQMTPADPTSHCDDSRYISTDSEDDNIVCDISIQADKPRLYQVKQAHELVIRKTDASLATKFLTISDAPHLDTKALIKKLDDSAKPVDLDVSTILAEQMEDPVVGTVRSWIRKNTTFDIKSPEIQQSKGLLRYRQKIDRLLIEDQGQLLCYNEPSDRLEEENLPICFPLSLFLACLRLGHYNEMGGHMGATNANAKRFYYWPGMFNWICALTADCLSCQNNKPKPKHRNEHLLEEWQNETVPFRTVHLDHKGPSPN